MQDAKILLIDDEKSILQMLEMTLRKEGFQRIYTATTAQEGLHLLEVHGAHIILLDVMLPDKTGYEVCPKIRELSDAHIIFVTARTSDFDVLTGFATGGDDYVTKPFNPLEVVARIKARLRRGTAPPIYKGNDDPALYDFGHFLVNESAGELIVNGESVSCPAQAFQLLLYLCKHPNIVFSKSQLYDAVWGMDGFGDDSTVMVHVRKIRERIETDPSDPKSLVTIRGLGYKLVKEKGI